MAGMTRDEAMEVLGLKHGFTEAELSARYRDVMRCGRPTTLTDPNYDLGAWRMAAGVSDRLWEIGDIVKLVEDAQPKPGKRGPYKKRQVD